MSLDARYQEVLARVGGRARLVAVSKGQPVSALQALYALGQRDFGENRADEMRAKAQAMPRDVRWHFLGNLQRNKLKEILETRATVHSFDRPELAAALRDAPLLVQVHLGGGIRPDRGGDAGPQPGGKHRNGLAPEKVEPALREMALSGVTAIGLMVLPPKGEDPRVAFRELRALRDSLQPRWPFLAELSMGMSEDYEAAIEEGATLVRVGRAIFQD